MRKYSKTDTWVLMLLSITFVLTDWRVYNVAISDIILIIIMASLFFKRSIRMKSKQLLLYVWVLALVFSNIGFNLLFNTQFVSSDGIRGLLKVLLYMTAMMTLYNHIIFNHLQRKLLNILSITTVVICIIGIYISLAIYLNGILPYEFFWKFTRTDLASYTYRGWGRNIIRARSVFSEPAYMGYYLNSILGIFYFNKDKHKIDKKVDTLITVTILLSFSFSAIVVMGIIRVLHYIDYKKIHGILKPKYIFSAFVILVMVVLMWDIIDKTIIIRTQQILSGADGSATARLLGSWAHINKDNIFIGNGIGNTPPLWNVFAYVLSDLGLIVFIVCIIFTALLCYLNLKMGLLFILQGFQKGAYLGVGFWIFMLLVIIYIEKRNDNMMRFEKENY